MKTHTHSGDKRCIALLSIFATLCSVYALALAYRLSGMTAALQSQIVSSTEISALIGDHGIGREDMRSFQSPQSRRILLRLERLKTHGAASQKNVR